MNVITEMLMCHRGLKPLFLEWYRLHKKQESYKQQKMTVLNRQ